MKVSEIMHKVYTIEEDVKLIKVAETFARKKISSVVYAQGGKAKGIITERDIIRHIDNLRKKKVSQAMTKKLVTINYEKDLEDAILLMKSKKAKWLLVVDEQKTLVGIITSSDIIMYADTLDQSFF